MSADANRHLVGQRMAKLLRRMGVKGGRFVGQEVPERRCYQLAHPEVCVEVPWVDLAFYDEGIPPDSWLLNNYLLPAVVPYGC